MKIKIQGPIGVQNIQLYKIIESKVQQFNNQNIRIYTYYGLQRVNHNNIFNPNQDPIENVHIANYQGFIFHNNYDGNDYKLCKYFHTEKLRLDSIEDYCETLPHTPNGTIIMWKNKNFIINHTYIENFNALNRFFTSHLDNID